MSESNPINESPFGAQFAGIWSLLQRYMADLDDQELAKLSKLDLRGTLALLKEQPALGASNALRQGADKSPEELAVSIIQERLEALTGQLSGGPEGTWGGRFLQRWRQLGGPVSCFSYARIQDLKQADREQTIKLFRNNLGSYQVRKLFNECTPEEAAGLLLDQHRMGGLMIMAMLL